MTHSDLPDTGAMTLETLRADVAAVLQLPVSEVLDDDDLLDLGLDSVRLMLLVQRWTSGGVAVDFGALAESPRLVDWWVLLSRAMVEGREGGSVGDE